MTFSQVQQGGAVTGTGTVSPHMTAASTAGNLLVATLFTTSGTGFAPANPGWLLAGAAVTSTNDRAEVWYYPSNPGGIGLAGTGLGAPSFTGPSGVNCRGCMAEYAVGAGNGQILDTLATAHGAGPTTSFPVSTATANSVGDLGIAAFGSAFSSAPSGAWAVPSGWTQGAAIATAGNSFQSDWKIGLPATTQSVTGSYSPSTNQTGWTAVLATFREVTPVTIATTTLPNGTAGTPYSQTLSASGGTGGPYTWAVSAGNLPSPAILTGSNNAKFALVAADITGLSTGIMYNGASDSDTTNGVPSSWPGRETPASGVLIQVVDFAPNIADVLSGSLDAELQAFIAGAPQGSWMMPYHECNLPSAGLSSSDINALDVYLLALKNQVNPSVRYGRGISASTYNNNLDASWITPGMDFYGMDNYQASNPTKTPATAFGPGLAAIRGIQPGAPVAIIETNTALDPESWGQDVATWAAQNGIFCVEFFWEGSGGTGQGSPWSSSYASTYQTINDTLAQGMTLGMSSGVIGGTPQADGVFSFTVQASDSAGGVATQPLTLTIAPGAVTSWSGSYAASEAFALPPPGDASCAVPVANTAGDWMFAIITWRQPATGDGVTVSVSDDAHNWWEPLGAPTTDTSLNGVTRTAVWAAPAARAASFVMAAPTGFVTAIAVQVIDVAGLGPWLSETTVNRAFTNAGTSVSLSHGTPSSQAFLITAAGTDNNSLAITGPGGSWTTLTPVSASNGTDHTADIELNAAYQLTTVSTSATWSASGSLDMSGIIAGVFTAAPAPTQPNPDWPVVITELAPGSGAQTPPSQLTFVDASAYQRAFTFTQGRQYTLGQLQAGQGVLTLDNQGGTFIPPGSGSFAGIDSGTPARVRLINPASLTPHNVIWNGFLQRWPPGWDQAERGITQATITDAWAYTNRTLASILRTEIQNDGPYAYWPLSDPVGTSAASNIAQGGSGLPLSVVTSKFGTTNASHAFGAESGTLPGDTVVTVTTSGQTSTATGVWSETLSGSALTTNAAGYALQCADPSFPPISAGVTVEVWLQPANASPNWNPGIWIIKDARGPVLKLLVDATNGNLELAWWNHQGVQQSNITVSTAIDYRNLAGLVHAAVAFTQTTWTVYVDGGGLSTSSGTFGGGGGLRAGFDLISFSGEADRFFTGNFWTGFLAHAAITPVLLPQVRALTHYFAGLFAITDDTASGRIDRLMQAAGWTGRRCLLPESGADIDQTVSCSDIAGQPAATALTNIAASTLPAVLAVAPTGDVFYLAKQYAYNQAIKWVLGTNVAAGEIPFLPLGASSGLDYDPARVVDDIQITHLDRQDVILPTGHAAAQSMAGQQAYGDLTYWQTGYLDGDATKSYTYGPGLYDLANWLAEVYGKPRLRGAMVTVEAAANAAGLAAWELYGGAAVGDMAQLNVRPVTDSPLVITVTGRISQTVRTLKFGEDGAVTASIDLVIDPAPEYSALTCDDPVRGLLNGENCLAW